MRQPYRIESVTLKGVGVFEHTHIDFPQIKSAEQDAKKAEIHIFTGPNGCGKSTLLYSLAAIFDFQQMQEAKLSKRLSSEGSEICFMFNNEAGFIKSDNVSGESEKARGFLSKEIMNYYRIIHERNYKRDDVCAFSAFAYSAQRIDYDSFETYSIENITDSPFKNALDFYDNIRPHLMAQWITNSLAKKYISRQKEKKDIALRYENTITHFCHFIKEICELDVSFDLDLETLDVELYLEGALLDFDVLPDGVKSVMGWIGDLALRIDQIEWASKMSAFHQPIILFLDEVDIHLHPKWQRRILPAIQKLLPNAQVFVSTHSPFVVGSVEDAYVYRLPEPRSNECRDSSVAEVISAIDSKAGKSYQLILAEIFDVDEEFDVETQKQLTDFKNSITAHMQGQQNLELVMSLAQMLSNKGEELSSIVSLELRQMQRLMSKNQG